MIVYVKLPNDFVERMHAFPFLHVLDQELQRLAAEDPDDDTYQLHLISLKKGIDVLNLLPFEAFYHEVEEEDLKSIFTAHRVCGNFTKTNPIDTFVSTTTSFVDASMGKNIAAAKKVGFDIGKNKWLLSEKVTHPGSIHKSNEIFSLLSGLTSVVQDISYVSSRKLHELYLDWNENPYLVIDLDLVDEEVNPEWLELIELSTNKRFIFLCSELNKNLQRDLVEDYIKTLPAKNTYKFFRYDSNIEFAKLISYSIGFVSQNPDLVMISTYCETLTYFLNSNLDLKLLGPKYFRGELKDYEFRDAKSFPYNTLFDNLVTLLESFAPEEH